MNLSSLFAKVRSVSRIYWISGVFTLIAVGIVVFVHIAQTSSVSVSVDQEASVVDEAESASPCVFPRYLDGVCVESERSRSPRTVGIMIENHYDARPLSGLADASVVYEAPVEGNYTRFLAVFPEDAEVQKIGPVRSARTYYLDWVSEYPDMLYMHVGGSPDALEKIKTHGIFDFNEFYRGWYYWRDSGRYAPHNVYTSSALFQKAMDEYANTSSTEPIAPWKFRPWDDCAVDCIHQITTTYAGETYEATWKYNTSTAMYERYEGGKPVRDAQTGKQIVVDTLILQYVDTTVLDTVGRLGMETLGRGEAYVFRNGFKVDGEWRKETRQDRTRFFDFDEEGHEIPFKAGKIWVSVINRPDGVSFE